MTYLSSAEQLNAQGAEDDSLDTIASTLLIINARQTVSSSATNNLTNVTTVGTKRAFENNTDVPVRAPKQRSTPKPRTISTRGYRVESGQRRIQKFPPFQQFNGPFRNKVARCLEPQNSYQFVYKLLDAVKIDNEVILLEVVVTPF
jgi:hypothetical protein